ncbi:hypothetical protein EHQ05_05485 [Leptospira yasudae]|uniref:Uncharacterized protein n=1 Tax=Leptospira yasudae TaxID=2202201 RepID=A0ABX9M9F2_9LEPT|nr:hypothetical protein [Leptospira yasudae]RHX82217.1 hypothetical protein DLM77_01795 [Leptospira yasudae]TGK30405.1 hypothetical protein EHQ05_05485 [Leptospira yasudae]TGM04215.1 hypothetical protein EHQ86_13250 [Leptospira yasudae]
MKAVEFIKKYEITPALAAGFLDHLRREPEEDVKDEILHNAFREFSGKDLERKVAVKEEHKAESTEEKTSAKSKLNEPSPKN